MLFSNCTKWPSRQRKPEQESVPLSVRTAERPPLRRRCDVEKRTDGSAFWGPSVHSGQPEKTAAPPPLPWKSTQKSDFSMRTVSSEERSANEQQRRDRACAMRTASIRHGDAPLTRDTEASANLRRFDRDAYAGRVTFPPGGKHTKTKSEFFVSPAEVQVWKQGLTTMSRRQFRAHPPAKSDAGELGLAEIQKHMLSSHFAVGVEPTAPAAGAAGWSSQTAAVFSPRSGLRDRPTRAVSSGESSVPLRDANLPDGVAGLVTTTSADFATVPHRVIMERRRLRGSGSQTPQTARLPPHCDARLLDAVPPAEKLSTPIRKQLRPSTAGNGARTGTRVHGAHSWQLGYSEDHPARFLTEQRLAFRRLQYAPDPKTVMHDMERQRSERRGSRDQMLHSSAVPL
eukprot:TRINITY_DN6064_c0_g2_i3.p1 TRINITY_DN6064_c0_g2~~TRINITY_DN6064_c0_g2_i3.p1  ORF type:complete len:399 (+),score=86.89 TRINITY_DN6064_c0_g2_i3:99-1295(+)